MHFMLRYLFDHFNVYIYVYVYIVHKVLNKVTSVEFPWPLKEMKFPHSSPSLYMVKIVCYSFFYFNIIKVPTEAIFSRHSLTIQQEGCLVCFFSLII